MDRHTMELAARLSAALRYLLAEREREREYIEKVEDILRQYGASCKRELRLRAEREGRDGR